MVSAASAAIAMRFIPLIYWFVVQFATNVPTDNTSLLKVFAFARPSASWVL
jgi:hypothetical protein